MYVLPLLTNYLSSEYQGPESAAVAIENQTPRTDDSLWYGGAVVS